MRTTNYLSIATIFCFALISSYSSNAQVFFQLPSKKIITLDNLNSVSCGNQWVENNATISLTQSTSTDPCPGSCYFQNTPTSVWLAPGKMKIDLNQFYLDAPIAKVEIDVRNFCGKYCTKASLITDGGTVAIAGNLTTSQFETITLNNAPGFSGGMIEIAACETEVLEIRVFSKNYQGEIIQVNPSFETQYQFNGF